jgi:hypothetical protein
MYNAQGITMEEGMTQSLGFDIDKVNTTTTAPLQMCKIRKKDMFDMPSGGKGPNIVDYGIEFHTMEQDYDTRNAMYYERNYHVN